MTGILRYKDTKREGGISIFSEGPTICDTCQVCAVHMECKTIHWLGQPSVISQHIEGEIEGYIVLHFISSSVVPTILGTCQDCDVHMECKTIHWMAQSSVIGPNIEADG